MFSIIFNSKYKSLILPLVMFLVAALFYWYEFLLRVSPSPISNEIMLGFDIDATSFGYLSSAYFISYALLQLPAGLWTDKLGPRRLLTIAILLCAISSMLFAKTSSFNMLCVARFFIGAGSAFAFVCCMKIVTIWFNPKSFPILSGLTLTIGSLGAVSGLILVALFLEYMNWRDFMNYMGWFGILLAVCAWFLIKDVNNDRKFQVHREKNLSFKVCLKDVVGSRQNWLIAIYGALTTAPTDAIGIWAVPYLKHVHGFGDIEASTAAASLFIGLAIGSPIMGIISNYLKSRKIVMFWSSLLSSCSLFAFIFIPELNFYIATALCLSAGFFGVYVMSFIVINDSNDSKNIATAVGFVNMLCMLGSFLLIGLMGYGLDYVTEYMGVILDASRTYPAKAYQLAFLFVSGFYLVSAFLVVPIIKESYKTRK